MAPSFGIWSTNSLINKSHGEDWYRMYVYLNVWDNAFVDDDEFKTKHFVCVSQVMKLLKETEKDIKLQKLDFILRNLNTDNDSVTVEEKSSLKGVKAYIKKKRIIEEEYVVSLVKASKKRCPYETARSHILSMAMHQQRL